MGIPSYFSWLVRHFEKKIIGAQSPCHPVHNFYLDFNCAIHPISRSHSEYSIDKMCDNVVVYLEYLINYVKPVDLVFIAIDGVAPVAKIKQQRLRRYKSVKETAEMNELKKQFGVEIPHNAKDFNMISPATEFMSILSAKINLFLKKCRNTRIIFSDASVPSEGEHKILQHIKTQPIEKNCVIYGLDSDLIMLSLCTRRDNVSLIRESTLIRNNNVDIDLDKFPRLDYFLVNELKKLLFSTLVTNKNIEIFTNANQFDLSTKLSMGDLYDQIACQEYDMECIIKDYIFMSFFFGNDFLPAFSTLKIREHGIEKIINAYHETLKNNDDYLCRADLTINETFFIDFIRNLSLGEEESLKQQKNTRDKRVLTHFSSTPTDYADAVDQYQKIEHLSKDYINVYQNGWQERYYHHYFHMRLDNVSQRSIHIDQICHDYLVGIQWNMKYYFDKCVDWYWFYNYDATPLLADFCDYLEKNRETINQVSFTHDHPVKPYHQLMMILPPQSANLLPAPFRAYMLADESPLIHYYPIDFELDHYGKQFRWETHPKIPFMDPQELPQYLDRLENQLTPEEYSRGQIGHPRVFSL